MEWHRAMSVAPVGGLCSSLQATGGLHHRLTSDVPPGHTHQTQLKVDTPDPTPVFQQSPLPNEILQKSRTVDNRRAFFYEVIACILD